MFSLLKIVSGTSNQIINLKVSNSIEYDHYPHFTDEETKAERLRNLWSKVTELEQALSQYAVLSQCQGRRWAAPTLQGSCPRSRSWWST